MEQCQFCGSGLGAKIRFCSNCGKPVAAVITTETASPKFDPSITVTSQIKDIPALAHSDTLARRPQAKIKKPNPVSMEAIKRTLFIVPEKFSLSIQEILAEFGVRAAGTLHSSDPALLVEMSKQFIRNVPQGAVQFVCIIGNWTEVPPSYVPNDFMDHDGDEFCQTDAFYGAIQGFDSEDPLTAIPEITVGRIPVADRDVVQRLLGDDPDVPVTSNSFQFGVTAKCWEIASNEIISSFSNLDKGARRGLLPQATTSLPKSAILCSPEWTEEHLRQVANLGTLEPYGILFFNVHGGADEPRWVGESDDGDYVKIFQPGTITDFNSAIVLSEACYGGAMFYDSPSIVEHFFANGGHSFVGSSTIAYGARSTPLSAADLIAKHYIHFLYEGLSQGESLKLAKLEALTEDPHTVEYGLKTALSFNLFGVPWQTLTRSTTPPISTSTIPSSPALPTGSVLNRVRGNLQAPTPTKSDTINKIRDQYRARLPPRNRQFMIEKDKILSKLREFQDFSLIINEIDTLRGSLENSQMDFVSAGDSKAYRLFCQTSLTTKSKRTLILMIDSQGKLIKTMLSKGAV
jgi:hypothetical protein